ncbi:hypothetical protein FH972_016821 [Carpinus fangiana]|uniref:Uncharacterized protein n=1 Tax=Carpinus fangiana TaxID=176857 RepID=A0A5N6RH28_9ROSI|nr:hypothetical protein FH972_016821 [Carpinus fangiana]
MLGHFLFLDHFKSEHTQWKQMQKGRFVRWVNHILELYAGKKPESSSKFQCLELPLILLIDKDIFKSREYG